MGFSLWNGINEKCSAKSITFGRMLTRNDENGHSCLVPIFITIIQTCTGCPTQSNLARKIIIKGIQFGKKELKLYLFADGMHSYKENLKDSTQKWPAKLQDIKPSHKSICVFIY